MFSLVGCLPFAPSAGGCPPLFGRFDSTTQPSDSPSAYMLDSWLIAFSNRPVASAAAGGNGASPVLACGVSMHAWGLRLRRARQMLAIAHVSVLPSAMRNDVGTPVAIISQLNTLPACAPVNASMAALRLATHDSGSGWFASPFLYDSSIHYSTPVYPGALRSLLGALAARNGCTNNRVYRDPGSVRQQVASGAPE